MILKPFISYGNENNFLEEEYFLPTSPTEIIVFRYLLMFSLLNPVEKCICFSRDNHLLEQDFYIHYEKLPLKNSEIFLDIAPGNGEIFCHMTHEKKRKSVSEQYFNLFYQTLQDLVDELQIHQDPYCEFAESFSCRFDKNRILLANQHRFELLKNHAL